MKLALLGDMAFFGRLSGDEAYFSEVADYLSEMDYVVGNLETPFSEKRKTYGAKSAYICANREDVSILKALHVDAVSLANNHIFDYGQEGYELTKRLMEEAGIEYFGVDGRGARVEVKGCRLAFEGFCCWSTNPLRAVPYGSYGVNEYDVGQVLQTIKYHCRDAYLPVIAVHAGTEHVNYPSRDHIAAARMLAEVGPMVYYGHHPHVLQGIEECDGSLVAYSLGNFCFDDVYTSVSGKEPLIRLSENNRTSCVLVVDIDGGKVLGHTVVPIYIDKERLKLGKGEAMEIITESTRAIHDLKPQEYDANRNRLLGEYMSGRKSSRNVGWYLKRLRPRYAMMLLNSRRNSRRYNEKVKKYIK